MFEDFLKELKEKLNGDMDEYAVYKEKYKRRFSLGREAGMTEEEMVLKFMSEEPLFMKNADENQNHDDMDVSLDLTFTSLDVYVNLGFTFNFKFSNENLKNYYNITFENNFLKISPKEKNIKRKYEENEEIEITIPKGYKIDDLKIETVSGDIQFSDEINTKLTSISTVSGDIFMNKYFSKELKISTISGDLKGKGLVVDTFNLSTISGDALIELNAIDLNISTISGDISINGSVEHPIKASTISGEISYNHDLISQTIGERIKNKFKFLKKD